MKNFRLAAFVAVGVLALAFLGGCQRSVSSLDTRAQSLPPAPVGVVEATPLDTAPPTQITPDQQVASLEPIPPASAVETPLPGAPQAVAPVAAAPVTREAMAGTWTVATDNPECRIILAFTKWSGGYRAATRRCNAPEIAAVSAWDVRDNRVVLVDANGNQVASLASTGPESYDGTTAGGTPVRFSR
ncbi:MAG TPA: protease inhibitor Inh/omp19 family protein [Rhizobiaceae bacterium]|nr:protease inhibitor Inh/omp19 family protein [Rhizobiaceae bacterium]